MVSTMAIIARIKAHFQKNFSPKKYLEHDDEDEEDTYEK